MANNGQDSPYKYKHKKLIDTILMVGGVALFVMLLVPGDRLLWICWADCALMVGVAGWKIYYEVKTGQRTRSVWKVALLAAAGVLLMLLFVFLVK